MTQHILRLYETKFWFIPEIQQHSTVLLDYFNPLQVLEDMEKQDMEKKKGKEQEKEIRRMRKERQDRDRREEGEEGDRLEKALVFLTARAWEGEEERGLSPTQTNSKF